MTVISSDVLITKRSEYVEKLALYQNTVIAIQGAIEAIDDLLAQAEKEVENERSDTAT